MVRHPQAEAINRKLGRMLEEYLSQIDENPYLEGLSARELKEKLVKGRQGICSVKEFGEKYGFRREQIEGMAHPRVGFVPEEQLPYDATTFSRFNAQEMKSQSKPETAVKLGKIVPDTVFSQIVTEISGYDRLSDFYANEEAVARTLGAMLDAGVINDRQLPELRTGTALSAAGKELIENTLTGKVFQGNPDAVRQMIALPGVRQSVVMGLSEISANRRLKESGYDLSEELAAAVDLVTRARVSAPDVYKEGMPVSVFGRQQGLFDDEFGDSSVRDAATLMLADILNSGKPSNLRKVLATYNKDAEQAAAGQMDIFSGEPHSKEEILTSIIDIFRNATPKEQQELINAAIADRKNRAGQESEQTPTVGESDTEGTERTGGNAGGDGERSDNLAEEQSQLDYKLSNEIDENGRQFVLTSSGEIEFGRIEGVNELADAPILLSEGVITNPKTKEGYGLVHIEARHGDQIRGLGFNSVIDFIEEVAKNYDVIREGKERDGQQTYLLQLQDKHNNTLIVELAGDDTYWNINTAGVFKTSYGRKGKEVYNRHTTEKQPAETAEASQDVQQSGTDTTSSMNAPTLPADKGSENSTDRQIKEPTEAQKAAGNYKMEHRRIDGYNISIENPKGSVRRGKDADGKEWQTEMHHDYGYIRGTEGVDGDHIDVFLSDTPEEGDVFVIDQVKADGTFDEHKVMYGFPSEEAAREAYLSNYEQGWTGLGAITQVSKDEFKKWVQSSKRKSKPFSEYKSVKAKDGNVLTESQADELLSNMKSNAVVASRIEVTNENWRPSVETPIGVVKMGENQKAKLFEKGRADQYGMLLDTLTEPNIILEERDSEENLLHERPSSYLFIKTFQKEDGSKYVHFESVTVSQKGLEVSISSHIIRENQLRNKMKSDRLLYKATALDESANSSAEQPINQGGSLSSAGKVNTLSGDKQAGI